MIKTYRPRARRQRATTDRTDGYRWLIGRPVTVFSPVEWDGGLPCAAKMDVILAFVSMYQRKLGDTGDRAAKVEIAIDRRIEFGSWEEVHRFEVEGRCRSRYLRSITLDRPPDSDGKEWGLRVRRITPDTDPRIHNKFYLDAVSQTGADGRYLEPLGETHD